MRIPVVLTFAAAAVLLTNACVFSSSGNSNAAPTPSSNSSAGDSHSTDGAASQGKTGEIRKTDFKNFTFEPYCAGEEKTKITVKNGEYSRDKDDDRMFFNVFAVTYGDVNADGDDDAIVLTNCNTGGTGQFTEGFIYGMKDGKPSLLGSIEGGDRAFGGLRSAKVEGGLIVVESSDAGPDGAACCPEFVVTTKYKLEGKDLKRQGKETRRELYPLERVKFDKGATGTSVKLKLGGDDDMKRYVIGAAAGQRLYVEANTDKLTFSLIRGEGEVVHDGDHLEVELANNGDYVIQVQKTTEKSVDATLIIEIR